MTYCYNNISIHTFGFFMFTTVYYDKYIFGLNPTNASIATLPVSSFIFPMTNQ